MSPTFNVKGLNEAVKLLEDAPRQIVLLGFGKAARAGIDVMAAELVRRTPIRTGKLVKSLKIKVQVFAQNATSPDIKAVAVLAQAGFVGKEATIANALEYGHSMVTPGGQTVGYVQAYPFMRPAFDASADAAVDAFAASLAATLK